MLRRDIALLAIVILVSQAGIAKAQGGGGGETPIIYDADMGPMIDDVGALATLHALAKSNKAEVLATVASNKYPGISKVFDVINTYYGKPNIPIGIPQDPSPEIKDATEFSILGGWAGKIIKDYPTDVTANSTVPSSVEVYRRVLSSQPDNSVTIVTVGFLTNLSDLLVSTPDEHSSLSGKELVKKKVERLVSMAGEFPSGVEYNIRRDRRSAKHVFDEWPTTVIFSGFEIGERVNTGDQLIKNDDIKNSPIRDIYQMKISDVRSSFDHTAVLVGVLGHEDFYNLVEGRIDLEWDGSNTWNSEGEGHYYLEEKMPAERVGAKIDSLMMVEPS